MKKFFRNNKYSVKNANKYGWGPSQALSDHRFQYLKKYIHGKKILDVGCGPGHLVDRLSKLGYQATGLDITKEFINHAKSKHSGEYLVGSAYKLPFKNKSFDTVFLNSILEHLKDDQQALEEAIRVGKRIVLTVPKVTPKSIKIRGLLFLHYQDKTHLRNYTKNKLEDLVLKSGAKKVEIYNVEQLPVRSFVFDTLKAPPLIRRIVIKLLFSIFGERKHYLELLAIIN